MFQLFGEQSSTKQLKVEIEKQYRGAQAEKGKKGNNFVYCELHLSLLRSSIFNCKVSG